MLGRLPHRRQASSNERFINSPQLADACGVTDTDGTKPDCWGLAAHWDKMRFIPGMRPFVMSRVPAGSWFVGIDERTAILGDGERWRVYGGGTVTARNGRDTVRYHEGEEFETPWPRRQPT